MKGAFLKKVKINCDNNAKIYIGPRTVMRNCHLTAIGDKSFIYIEGGSTLIKKSSFTVSQNSGVIQISTGFTTEGADIRAHEGKTVSIGRNCMFSSGIFISTTDYHSIISLADSTRNNPAKDVTIGNHVWLGRNVDVLKGAIISNDTVVGMGSTVTELLSDEHAVYVGSPARKVKEGVSWKREMI